MPHGLFERAVGHPLFRVTGHRKMWLNKYKLTCMADVELRTEPKHETGINVLRNE